MQPYKNTSQLDRALSVKEHARHATRLSPPHAVSAFLFALVPKYAHGVCQREAAGRWHKGGEQCLRNCPSVGFAPAVPEPLLAAQHSVYVGWHGGNACVSRLRHGSVRLSKGHGLTLLHILQNPVNANRECALAGITAVP